MFTRARLAFLLVTSVTMASVGHAAGPLGAPAGDDPEIDMSVDYFVGIWGMGAADECQNGDTMAFYQSGAWAITNGGGNPVEEIGVWELEQGALIVTFSGLHDPALAATTAGQVGAQGDEQFTLASELLPNGEMDLFRCAD